MILTHRYEKAKTDLGNALTILDAHLLHRTYLVGEQITMADIAIVSALVYPFKLVTDKNYLKNYNNVTRWFTTCVNQPEFMAVIGTVVMCKKELLAEGQAAPVVEKAAAPKKEKKVKEKDPAEEMDEPAVVEKKAEHPYKIMDREQPSPFSMDTWKKTYSNATSYEQAMEEFWKMFDSNGWTLWYQMYNYNEDNKRIFMTANAIGGFQQRTDEIRKWAFGVQDVRDYTALLFCFRWDVVLIRTSRTIPSYSDAFISDWSYIGVGNRRDGIGNCRCVVITWEYGRSHEGGEWWRQLVHLDRLEHTRWTRFGWKQSHCDHILDRRRPNWWKANPRFQSIQVSKLREAEFANHIQVWWKSMLLNRNRNKRSTKSEEKYKDI